jgi:hypothetical protein
MEKKNIDRLFQEKLKDLEVKPNKKVWNNIESKLKKKKRRVLPIWWFSTGIAALLVVGFILFPLLTDNTNKTVNSSKKQPIIIAAPEINSKNNNSIKKEIDTLFNKSKERTILVKNDEKPKRNTSIIIAYKTEKKTKKETKDTVSKRAMKKIFLTDKTINKALDSIKYKTKIAQKNHLNNNKNPNLNITKNTNTLLLNKDSIAKKKTIKPKKDILTAINNDPKEEKNAIKKRWSISPTVAVLNSNSFSNASPIDKNLSSSTKGNNSYSYGIQVGVKVSNKWTIQSGIHLQEIRFSNSQISVAPASSSTSNVAFSSGDNFSLNDASENSFNLLSLSAISLDGDLDQKYGYIEVPLEVKYNFFETKKLKTQLVVGFSSLFLNKNTINLKASSFTTSGKANNLNNINFSGNFGFDFNYMLDKNWSINLNPMLKTQLNTFNENANDFKPYFIGVYTGINYQF